VLVSLVPFGGHALLESVKRHYVMVRLEQWSRCRFLKHEMRGLEPNRANMGDGEKASANGGA